MFWVIEAVSGRTLTACGADGQAVDQRSMRDARQIRGRQFTVCSKKRITRMSGQMFLFRSEIEFDDFNQRR
jgi:hypothetical protein